MISNFKFFQPYNIIDVGLLHIPHVPLLITPHPPASPTRVIAVIATSLRDFNNWRRETLRGNEQPRYGTPNTYVHGRNMYRAILLPDDVRGHMFDGYMLTSDAFEFRENYGYIQTIISDINTYCLRRNTNENI